MVEESFFQKHHRGARHQGSSVCFWSTNVMTIYDDVAQSATTKTTTTTNTTITNNNNNNHSKIMVPLVYNGDPNSKESNKPLEMSGSDWFQQCLEIMKAMHDTDSNPWDGNDSNDENDDDYDESNINSSVNSDNNKNGPQPNTQVHLSLNDLILEDDEHVNDIQNSSHGTNETSTKTDANPLFFTFRADIPKDIPPTFSAVSGRIFYSTVVHIVTKKEGKSIVIQAPFTVIASSNVETLKNNVSKAKISIGTVHVVSHTKPYLIPLSPTYKSEPWGLSVKRQHCRPDNIKTISVGDHDKKCCSLTIIGGGVIVPGESILLQFSFPGHNHPLGKDVLPCYQVSACLHGNEYVIENDGTRKKSRTYSFDTDHLEVIPGVTTSVSLRLRLPHDCPISVSTDFFAIQSACRIDLTVKDLDDNNFRFLTVEFPCQVNHDGPTFEPMENDLPPDLENRLFAMKWSDESLVSKVLKRIVSSEVFNDLRILSLLSLNE
jgi:hypothetical protein